MLGTSRPHNGGVEEQRALLALTCADLRIATKTRKLRDGRLELSTAPSDGVLTIPMWHSIANLENVGRGNWQATNVFNGAVMATGRSVTDLTWRTLNAIYRPN